MAKCKDKVYDRHTRWICIPGYGPTGAVTAKNQAEEDAMTAGTQLQAALKKLADAYKCPNGCTKGKIDIGNPALDVTRESEKQIPERAKSIRDRITEYTACARARVTIIVPCYPVDE